MYRGHSLRRGRAEGTRQLQQHVRRVPGADWLAARQGTTPTDLQPSSQYILSTRIPLNRFRRPRSTARSPSAAKTCRARPRPAKTPGLCSVSLIGAPSVVRNLRISLAVLGMCCEHARKFLFRLEAGREAGFCRSGYMTLSTLGFAASAMMELALGNLFIDCLVATACFLTCCIFYRILHSGSTLLNRHCLATPSLGIHLPTSVIIIPSSLHSSNIPIAAVVGALPHVPRYPMVHRGALVPELSGAPCDDLVATC